MNNYMYGEDPAEAMDSAAARLALGERSAEMRSYPYGRAPWGVRGDGPKHEHSGRGPEGISVQHGPSLTDDFAAVTTYQKAAAVARRDLGAEDAAIVEQLRGAGIRLSNTEIPTTGITPRTLEMLWEIKEAVRKFDDAVAKAAIERDQKLAAIYKDYNL